MYETHDASSRRRLWVSGGFAVGVGVVALLAFWVFAPSVRARTTGPEPVNAAVVSPPTLGTPAPIPSPASPAVPSTPAPALPVVEGWPASVSGRVRDAEGRPIAGASVVAAGREVRTDAEGTFTLGALPASASLVVKVPGYAKATVGPTRAAVDIKLRRQPIKAAYLTYYGFADRQIRNRVLDLVARTELNAVVLDVKGDRGWIPYRTEVPLALAAGAQGPVILKDFDGMLTDLRARGIYTIARIVVFKDNVLAQHRRDLAIIDTRTRKPWTDREGLAWVDPFRTEVWDYNLAIAREAIRKGFDEVQFDYVRFPTDGKLASARYARPNTKEARLATIAGFLGRARGELGAMGAFVGADVFGYTAFNENDTDIGQRIEELAPHVDYLCPMVYPSGYHVGIPGYRNPVAHPYQVVHESVRLIRKRAAGQPVQVRPWLQDFKDYAFDRRIFGVPEIRAQIKAADDAGALGFMLWNPKNDYTGAALRPKATLAAK